MPTADKPDLIRCSDARNTWRWQFAAAMVEQMQSVHPLEHADNAMRRLTEERGAMPTNWPRPADAARALIDRWD